jgi:LDH2 family malate/lactate/ureidoglycolate dehydrogenase
VIVDKDGKPSTDPNDLYAGGALLPVGGHKGYALAMMVEILGMALGGADEPEMHGPSGKNSGSTFLAIDPTVFRPFEAYTRSVERLVKRVTSVPPAPGFDAVLLPGDPEHRTRAERARSISLPPATWQAIAAEAKSLGVPVPDVAA